MNAERIVREEKIQELANATSEYIDFGGFGATHKCGYCFSLLDPKDNRRSLFWAEVKNRSLTIVDYSCTDKVWWIK